MILIISKILNRKSGADSSLRTKINIEEDVIDV